MSAGSFRLNPGLDVDALSRAFSQRRRIHIPDFLVASDADRLLEHLRQSEEWQLVINQKDKLFELSREAQGALTASQKEELDVAVYLGAREGFQFRFENIRVSDSVRERAAKDDLLNRFARFLGSEPVLDLVREITGLSDIGYADAQATAYSPGHFLTAHDDDVEGKNRRAAYVMNLSRHWRTDWGGLLMFHGKDGHVEDAYVPSFNALNIFAVPQAHSVSVVAPFAPARRYSVTGWLRAGKQPD